MWIRVEIVKCLLNTTRWPKKWERLKKRIIMSAFSRCQEMKKKMKSRKPIIPLAMAKKGIILYWRATNWCRQPREKKKDRQSTRHILFEWMEGNKKLLSSETERKIVQKWNPIGSWKLSTECHWSNRNLIWFTYKMCSCFEIRESTRRKHYLYYYIFILYWPVSAYI